MGESKAFSHTGQVLGQLLKIGNIPILIKKFEIHYIMQELNRRYNIHYFSF